LSVEQDQFYKNNMFLNFGDLGENIKGDFHLSPSVAWNSFDLGFYQ